MCCIALLMSDANSRHYEAFSSSTAHSVGLHLSNAYSPSAIAGMDTTGCSTAIGDSPPAHHPPARCGTSELRARTSRYSRGKLECGSSWRRSRRTAGGRNLRQSRWHRSFRRRDRRNTCSLDSPCRWGADHLRTGYPQRDQRRAGQTWASYRSPRQHCDLAGNCTHRSRTVVGRENRRALPRSHDVAGLTARTAENR